MLEDLNDVLSLLVTAGFVIVGISVFFIVSGRHHNRLAEKSERRFENLLDDMDDAYDDDENGPYFG